MEALRKRLFSPTSYETTPKIKQEFVDLLTWYRIKMGVVDSTEIELKESVDSYLKEKDIALYGDIRKLHGANTRNAKFELTIAVCAAIVGCIVAVVLVHFFR